ncbi:MAG TPA: hypothetical protein VEI97_04340, partial [bacterium]|nr:hypothetical protein [bacterium]
MILRGLKQRWGLALALIGLLLAGYGWATYFPPNLAPHLPANWTPGADRWDAAWVPIPEGEPPWLTGYGWHCRGGKWDWFDYRINPSTRRIGSVRLASWNGVGPPRYSCEFADGPSNEIVKVPLIDPA